MEPSAPPYLEPYAAGSGQRLCDPAHTVHFVTLDCRRGDADVEGAREAVRALGDAGLVAVSSCGHWWTYPFRMSREQMHDVARFNRTTPCPFCLAERDARARAQARPPSRRVN